MKAIKRWVENVKPCFFVPLRLSVEKKKLLMKVLQCEKSTVARLRRKMPDEQEQNSIVKYKQHDTNQ